MPPPSCLGGGRQGRQGQQPQEHLFWLPQPGMAALDVWQTPDSGGRARGWNPTPTSGSGSQRPSPEPCVCCQPRLDCLQWFCSLHPDGHKLGCHRRCGLITTGVGGVVMGGVAALQLKTTEHAYHQTSWPFSGHSSGRPEVRTPHFPCRVHGFNPWSGN